MLPTFFMQKRQVIFTCGLIFQSMSLLNKLNLPLKLILEKVKKKNYGQNLYLFYEQKNVKSTSSCVSLDPCTSCPTTDQPSFLLPPHRGLLICSSESLPFSLSPCLTLSRPSYFLPACHPYLVPPLTSPFYSQLLQWGILPCLQPYP
mmetsp:Transcript_7435/g.15404  ORF Transcript_7435/g.15404 Transcript_7435/m.15404 type:complete len:147 (+) Transcript_7435:2896-3336(+)